MFVTHSPSYLLQDGAVKADRLPVTPVDAPILGTNAAGSDMDQVTPLTPPAIALGSPSSATSEGESRRVDGGFLGGGVEMIEATCPSNHRGGDICVVRCVHHHLRPLPGPV